MSSEQNIQIEVVPEDRDHDEIVKTDLFTIITLQGATCTRMTDYELRAELDYVVTCETGDKYRVHVSTVGKVHVKPHETVE